MLNVAIAEDDFRVAGVHEKFLAKIEGITIVGKALNAHETMALLSEHPVDLLLLDIYMPDQLGTELIPDIHKQFPEVDIIIITAADDTSVFKTAVRNGVINYLIKPVTLEQFINVIEDYRRHKEMLDNKPEIDQSFVDQFLGTRPAAPTQAQDLPKGIDALTLTKVKGILHEVGEGISAENMGVQMGASRTTARRYLEYLVSAGEAKAELEYGIVGRPERRYYTG